MAGNVVSYRKFLGYTQADMAELFGISVQAYSRKERGITAFNDKEKLKIKELLVNHFPDITIDDIFFAEKVPKVEKTNEGEVY